MISNGNENHPIHFFKWHRQPESSAYEIGWLIYVLYQFLFLIVKTGFSFSVYLSDPVLESITQWNRKTTTATLDAICDSTKHPYQAKIWKVIQARGQKNFPTGALF